MKFEDIPRLTGNAVQFRRVMADPAIPGNIVPCLMCGKPFIMPPFIGQPDQMCGECLRTYAGTAKVVCRGCRAVVCRLKPAILQCGFHIRPHMILHVKACMVCRPNLQESVIEEIAEWERHMGRGKIILPFGR